MFATIGWMTSEGFVQLRHQVTMALNPSVSSSDLKKWRRHFLMLSEIVLHMGRCFGPLMLIWIVYIFINVIGNSFYLLNSVIRGISDSDDQPSSEIPFWICTVTRNLIFLFILASTPVTLQHQVKKPHIRFNFNFIILILNLIVRYSVVRYLEIVTTNQI